MSYGGNRDANLQLDVGFYARTIGGWFFLISLPMFVLCGWDKYLVPLYNESNSHPLPYSDIEFSNSFILFVTGIIIWGIGRIIYLLEEIDKNLGK